MVRQEKVLHRLVSPFILCKYGMGENSGQLEGATLFTDVAGFSTITTTLMQYGQNGAEALAILMRAVFEPVVGAVYARGGFITTFAGDAFTALFPDQQVPWQDTAPLAPAANRALAAAWAIQQQLKEQRVYETPYGGFPLGVKIGIATGSVAWRIVAAQDRTRAAFYFRGAPIDAGAGAEKYARKNDVVLAPAAHAVLKDVVDGELLDLHLRVHKVSGILPTAQPFDLSSVPYQHQNAFLPGAVVKQKHRGEFRQNVNLFIGLQGDPSDDLLGSVVREALRLQQRYGGLLNRIDFGDKGCTLVMFWGAPVGYEDDIERALSLLLELQEATGIPLRAGMTMSISHAGFVGAALHEEYTCHGTGVNMAARLMMSAPWDCIWVDRTIGQRAQRAFEIEYEDSRAFKGFATPQEVYAVLGRAHTDSERAYDGPLVGRRREMESLRRFAEPLTNAETEEAFAGIALLTGEMGQGKSRLAHDFRSALAREAGSNAPQWFVCQTEPTSGRTLNPFRHWLRRYFSQSRGQSDSRNKRAFSRKLRRLVETVEDERFKTDLDRGRSFLGALIDLHWEQSLYAELDAESRHENTIRALRILLLAESCHRPVILLIEDADWLDDESKTFIQGLTRNVAAYPLGIIMTARERATVSWLFGIPGAKIESIPLGDLSQDELAEVAESLLDGPVTHALAHLLKSRTGGNPFFSEQLLRYLRDEGLLVRLEAGWAPELQAVEASRIPDNLRYLLTARLDGMPVDVLDLVQTASVLGHEFVVDWLEAMLPERDEVREDLLVAEQAGILTGLSWLHYMFRNMLLRDVAYEMQLQARRCELHREAARALESIYASDLGPHVERIAFHYEQAVLLGLDEAREGAIAYLRRAGEKAAANYENRAAVDIFGRALALVSVEQLDLRFNLLLQREEAADQAGLPELQATDLQELTEIAARLEDPIRVADAALRRARYGIAVTTDRSAAQAAAAEALAAAESVGDYSRQVQARIYWAEALHLSHQLGAAQDHVVAAVTLAREIGDLALQALALRTSGAVSHQREAYDDAITANRQSLELCRQLGDRRGVLRAISGLGLSNLFKGYPEKALDFYLEALTLARQIGSRRGEMICLYNTSAVSGYLGQWPQVLDYAGQVIELSRELGSRHAETGAMRHLAQALLFTEQIEAAVEHLRKALEISREMEHWTGESEALKSLGECMVYLRRAGSAASYYEALLQKATVHEETEDSRWNTHLQFSALSGLVIVAGLGADDEEAQRRGMQLLELLAHTGQKAIVAVNFGRHNTQPYALLYRALAVLGDERASPVLREGYRQVQTQAARLENKALRQSYLRKVPHNQTLLKAAQTHFPGDVPEEEVDLDALFLGQAELRPNAREAGVADELRVGEEADTVMTEPTSMVLTDVAPAAANAPRPARARTPDGEADVQSRGDVGHARAGNNRIDLSGAGLSGARLNGVSLVGCSLRGTDLSNAQLRAADLRHADLRGADLRNADLRGADLRGAQLRGADLSGVRTDDETLWPDAHRIGDARGGSFD